MLGTVPRPVTRWSRKLVIPLQTRNSRKGKRGRVAIADRSGGKVGYQTLIDSALREYVEGKTPKWEETLRCIVREEMSRNNAA